MKTTVIQFLKRWLTGCLLIFITGCSSHNESPPKQSTDFTISTAKKLHAQQLLYSIKDSIHSGDMITRTGNDFTSYCLRQFCRFDKTYSHCGIASIEHDTVFVYHALGGEFNPDQKLLREPVEVFVSVYANNGFGVFRFTTNKKQNSQLLNQVQAAYSKGITFDMDFDLATDDKMYCSEFTAKMFRRAFQNDTMFTPTYIAAFSYLSPDNLFIHPLCHSLYRVEY